MVCQKPCTVSCWEEGKYPLGSIGTPLSSVSVRIGKDDEIQVKGPVVMKGYYNRPIETLDTFTADGWLKTGDAGKLTNKVIYILQID